MMVMSGWSTCQICPSLDRSPAPLTAMICIPSVVSICPLGSERPAGEESSPCIVGLARLGVTTTVRERIKVCSPYGVQFYNSMQFINASSSNSKICTCLYMYFFNKLHTRLKLNTCLAFPRKTSKIELLLVTSSSR